MTTPPTVLTPQQRAANLVNVKVILLEVWSPDLPNAVAMQANLSAAADQINLVLSYLKAPARDLAVPTFKPPATQLTAQQRMGKLTNANKDLLGIYDQSLPNAAAIAQNLFEAMNQITQALWYLVQENTQID